MNHARLSAAALVALFAVFFILPGTAAGATFDNDFTQGQTLDAANLATSTTGGGVAAVAAGRLSLSTPVSPDSAVCYFRAPVTKNQVAVYATRFRIGALNDGGSLAILDMHAGASPPVSSSTRLLSGRVVRSGVTYGFQLLRVGVDGITRYYNFANATWGVSPAKFSLQPSVTYVLKFETNSNGQFRYVVCSQAGNALVNGMTMWTPFSTVLGDASNTYWPYLGDADAAAAGTLDVDSIAGPASSVPTPDTTPPLVTLTAPADGSTVAGLVPVAATASDSGTGVSRVEFRVDGELIGAPTGPSYAATWNSALALPGSHTIEATAHDFAGNSATSSVRVQIAPPDTTSPNVIITSPADAAVVSGIVSLSASAADVDSGVARVEFRVDGVLVGTAFAPPYTVTWDSTASLGSHTIEAKGFDVAGNSATSAVTVLVVDTAPPAVFIQTPPNGAAVFGLVTIQASASDSGSGVAQVEFRVDGAAIGTDDTPPYAATWDATGAASGSHVLEAIATDGAGNTGVASVTVTVPLPDVIPPTVSIVVPSEGATVTGTVLIGASAGDVGSGMSRVEFFVDGVFVGVSYRHMYVASWDSSGAVPGPHVITATAYDLVGNSASASITVQVPDQTVPTVVLTSPLDGALVSGDVPLEATAWDADSAVDSVEFRVDGAVLAVDSSAPYSAAWDSSAASPGAHTITATAFDAAGNTNSASATVLTPDPVPPTISMGSPADGATVSGTVPIAATASDVGWGVAYVEFSVDGSSISSDTASPFAATWDSAAALPGAHTITATAFDKAGNSSSTSVSVVLSASDVMPPTVTITSPANGATVSSSVGITASAADSESGVGGVQFRVDGVYVFSDTIAPYEAVWDATGAATGPHTITARAYDLAGNSATATISVTIPAPNPGTTFTNDFTLGQPLDTSRLGTSVVGGGTVTMTGTSMLLSTSANTDSAICYFVSPILKNEASTYAVKVRFSGFSDGAALGVLDLHNGDTPPSETASGYLSARVVRSGLTHGLQLRRVGTDGITRYYNFSNATWGTTATKFSLQPNVTYIIKMDVNTAGQFRYVVCGQSGNPLVNGTTAWTSLSTVYNNASNTYWPYIGDALPSGFGTLEVFSITGR